MNYEEALQYIHSPRYNKMKLGLDQIRSLMNALDNPQKKVKCIHIAGTNGKGSVASYLAQILQEAGYKTGLFTSPYIERFNERIKVNGKDISDDSLANITENIKEKIEKYQLATTEFEIMTAIAFQHFFEEACDIVVLEVGLGGRLDSTNVIDDPLLSIITSISFDHQGILGSTLPEIAREKAGIIKKNRPVLVYSQAEEVERAIGEVAKSKNSTIFQPDFSQIKPIDANINGQSFHYKILQNLEIGLLGEHQLKNAALAIEAVHILNEMDLDIDEEALRNSLVKTTWPGRFEIIHNDPVVVIDGAHNIDSVRSLVDNLTKYFPEKKIISILGMLGDKDVDHIIETVLPLVDEFITVTPANPRAVNASELAERIKNRNGQAVPCESYKEAIKIAFERAEEGDVICSFGSLYYIGEIRKIIRTEKWT